MLQSAMFDPLSDSFARDPYPAYAALRAGPGPHYFPDFDIWLLSRFADVNEAALDRSLVRVLPEAPEVAEARRRQQNFHDMPMHARFVQFSLLDSEDAVHDRLRRLVLREFTPAVIARLRQDTEAFVEALVEGMLARGRIDFVADFAAHIPGLVIGRLLGVPDEDCPRLRRWSEDIVQYFDLDRSAERKALAEDCTAAFHDYLLALTAARRAQPRDDILSRLAAAEAAGDLSHDECISTAMLILMAGHGSTIDVMASGLRALLRFPAQMRRLRAETSLMPSAVQEMFRFESPLPFFHRHVTRPVTLAGRAFAPGEKVGLLYGAANRDPLAFADPDRFDVGRAPNRHLAFAAGSHFCLGLHLARLTMETVFTLLLRRTRSITLEEAPSWRRGLAARGPLALRIALTAA